MDNTDPNWATVVADVQRRMGLTDERTAEIVEVLRLQDGRRLKVTFSDGVEMNLAMRFAVPGQV